MNINQILKDGETLYACSRKYDELYPMKFSDDKFVIDHDKPTIKVGYACWYEISGIPGLPVLGREIDLEGGMFNWQGRDYISFFVARNDEEIAEARKRYLALPRNHKIFCVVGSRCTTTVEKFESWLEEEDSIFLYGKQAPWKKGASWNGPIELVNE